MITYGPRFSGGYQFMRSHGARLERGQPIRVERIGDGAYAQIVPLTGGREKSWDVCGQWRNRAGVDVTSTYIAHDELEARSQFVRLVREILNTRDASADK